MDENIVMFDVDVVQTAKVCHTANKAYCESIGDKSQVPWELAPDWQKDSAINGVVHHLEALHQGQEASPASSHESWMEQKIDEGWVYGSEKDPEAKTHPCIKPYDELPMEQKIKDYIFCSIVTAFYKGRDQDDG